MNCVRCAGCLSVTFQVDRHLADYELRTSGYIEFRDEGVPASDAGLGAYVGVEWAIHCSNCHCVVFSPNYNAKWDVKSAQSAPL